MVLAPRRTDPEELKATIEVKLQPFKTELSLSAPEEESHLFQLIISLRITESSQPGQAITICTKRSVFHRTRLGQGLDMLVQGAIPGLVNKSDPEKRISFGHFHISPRSINDSSLDLRFRGCKLFTIPGDGSEVIVRHDLPWSRIFKNEGKLKKEGLRPGETYRAGINPEYIGTTWWCWGDLETNLKSKKLCAWMEDFPWENVKNPTDEEIEKGRWVLGIDAAYLKFEDKTEGGRAEFSISE